MELSCVKLRPPAGRDDHGRNIHIEVSTFTVAVEVAVAAAAPAAAAAAAAAVAAIVTAVLGTNRDLNSRSWIIVTVCRPAYAQHAEQQKASDTDGQVYAQRNTNCGS
jgi:hypothetical protein